MLQWGVLTRDEFERAVESLVVRVIASEQPHLVARAFDGRGGDGGIDIEVVDRETNHRVQILQLKHFPEGFSGGFREVRRRQITESFRAALRQDMDEWTLVVPRKPTPAELDFLAALESEGGPRITCWGPPELDAMLSRYPELEEYITRDPVRTALDRFSRSSAAVTTVNDYVDEVQKLTGIARGWSPYWAPRVSHAGGRTAIGFEALRPDASEREPLTFTLDTNWDGHADLLAEYTRSVEFGFTNAVELPPEVVLGVAWEGPDWFRRRSGAGTVLLGPLSVKGTPGRITCLDADGRSLMSRNIVIDRVGRGSRGGRLEVSVAPGVTITLTLAFDSASGSLAVQSTMEGLSGGEARQHLRLLDAMSRAAGLRVQFEDVDVKFEVSGERPPPSRTLMELVDDVAQIEDLAGTSVRWPRTLALAAHERVWIRAARLMLEGRTVLVPGSLSVDLDVSDLTPSLEKLLTRGAEGRFVHPAWSVTIFGEDVELGDVVFWHPRMRVGDADAALAVLRDGRARSLHVEAGEADGLMAWMPDRSGSDDASPVVGWGIADIDEHPALPRTAPAA